jgi:CRP-like cAMP-binding protein
MPDTSISRLPVHNRLLLVLPAEEFGILEPHLELMSLARGMLLAQAGDPLSRCYFPNNGMISLLSVTEQGHAVEVGYVGHEGMVGLPVILGQNEMPCQALVQAPTDVLSVDARHVRKLFEKRGVFHDIALRYTSVIIKQIAQTCVCNHFHTIEARLCRWLTVMCERSNNNHLVLTQEFLAHMLGVQRTSIGLIAHSLLKKGIIRYSRGKVEILDAQRLKASACECYFIVQDEYEKFLSENKFPVMSDSRQTQRSF